MKKILNLILASSVLLSVTSCDLSMDYPLGPDPEDAYTLEYCQGMRGGAYTNMKNIMSGDFYQQPDLFTDVLSVCAGNGNNGFYIFNWYLYPTDQTVTGMWSVYYGVMMNLNFSLKHMQETLDYGKVSSIEADQIKMFMGEMRFFRAFTMYRASLVFCADYDPAKAAEQLGLPYPTVWDPDAKLARGTLAQLYVNIEKDVVAAEAIVNTPGSVSAIYLTKDAITAFRAQLALQIHEYAKASQYAQSLYGAYPLVQTKADLEKMWFEDSSSENILQLEVLKSTMGTVGSFSTYMSATLVPGSTPARYTCTPYYVPEQHVVNLYSGGDNRMGVYIRKTDYTIAIPGAGRAEGYLINKFRGNQNFETSPGRLTYRSRPKMFRVADMYLIDAEAQYMLNGGGAGPLNILRQSRGLETTAATGDALFTEIKNERFRELLGEGGRLYDLKRWTMGFKRNFQSAITNVIDTSNQFKQTMSRTGGLDTFVWPIPQNELVQNPNFGQQNPGY